MWEDERTVNVITNAVFSPHAKISVMAMRFMLGLLEPHEEEKDSDDEGDKKSSMNVKDIKLLHVGTS